MKLKNQSMITLNHLCNQTYREAQDRTIKEELLCTGRNFQGRDRGRHSFIRNTGENDPYNMTTAALNIYKNQALPIGIHNLSKRFRPNLNTIQVLYSGTKFIPK